MVQRNDGEGGVERPGGLEELNALDAAAILGRGVDRSDLIASTAQLGGELATTRADLEHVDRRCWQAAANEGQNVGGEHETILGHGEPPVRCSFKQRLGKPSVASSPSLGAARGYPCRMATVCPRDATEMVEVERSGVRIDACPTCRGVFLDRGELDRVLERERRGVEEVDRDDEEFMREVTGQGHGRGHEREVTGQGHEREHGRERYGFDAQTAQRLFEDYRSHKKQHKRKSLLNELLG